MRREGARGFKRREGRQVLEGGEVGSRVRDKEKSKDRGKRDSAS